MTAEVLQAETCAGFAVAPDGSRFRLRFARPGQRDCILELPVSGLTSLMKVLPEIQQFALPRARGDDSLRVMRQPVGWSLERDMIDESLVLVLITDEGFEWCFNLSEAEVFKMASYLRDERMSTLAAPDLRQ
jgi:hypothetical protein